MKPKESPKEPTDAYNPARPNCTLTGDPFAPYKLVGDARRLFKKYVDGKKVK